jgi:hypothetical protein
VKNASVKKQRVKVKKAHAEKERYSGNKKGRKISVFLPFFAGYAFCHQGMFRCIVMGIQAQTSLRRKTEGVCTC